MRVGKSRIGVRKARQDGAVRSRNARGEGEKLRGEIIGLRTAMTEVKPEG